ncbi:DUF916 and DUF3324 domain-containing protein [Virgibacillus kimchii]
MMKRITMILAVLLLSLSFHPVFIVQANDEQVGYSVQAELPDNQLDDTVSYFNLRVEPDQEQDLNITVFNHENEELTIRANVVNASTNSNGLVVYEAQEEIDSSLENPVTDLVTFEQEEWTIPPTSSKVITATLNMPDETFDGIKLGGLHVEKILEEEEAEAGVNIQNKYDYVIGLQLSENDGEVEPDLALTSVEPGLVNHRTAVVAKVQNSQPVLMEDVHIEAAIKKDGSQEPIQEMEQSNIRMAPNSTMDVVIDWNNQPLRAGDYELNMMATDGANKWEWQESFTIHEEAESLNESAVELEEEESNFVWYIAGMIVLLVIIIILLIYIRRLKNK